MKMNAIYTFGATSLSYFGYSTLLSKSKKHPLLKGIRAMSVGLIASCICFKLSFDKIGRNTNNVFF